MCSGSAQGKRSKEWGKDGTKRTIMCEEGIKEGKGALKWVSVKCHVQWQCRRKGSKDDGVRKMQYRKQEGSIGRKEDEERSAAEWLLVQCVVQYQCIGEGSKEGCKDVIKYGGNKVEGRKEGRCVDKYE